LVFIYGSNNIIIIQILFLFNVIVEGYIFFRFDIQKLFGANEPRTPNILFAVFSYFLIAFFI